MAQRFGRHRQRLEETSLYMVAAAALPPLLTVYFYP